MAGLEGQMCSRSCLSSLRPSQELRWTAISVELWTPGSLQVCSACVPTPEASPAVPVWSESLAVARFPLVRAD